MPSNNIEQAQQEHETPQEASDLFDKIQTYSEGEGNDTAIDNDDSSSHDESSSRDSGSADKSGSSFAGSDDAVDRLVANALELLAELDAEDAALSDGSESEDLDETPGEKSEVVLRQRAFYDVGYWERRYAAHASALGKLEWYGIERLSSVLGHPSLRHAVATEPLKVVELGCGASVQSILVVFLAAAEIWKRSIAEYVCIDFSIKALEVMRSTLTDETGMIQAFQRATGRTMRGDHTAFFAAVRTAVRTVSADVCTDLENSNVVEGQFADIVVDKATLDAVRTGGDDRGLALLEGVKRILRPGGVFILITAFDCELMLRAAFPGWTVETATLKDHLPVGLHFPESALHEDEDSIDHSTRCYWCVAPKC